MKRAGLTVLNWYSYCKKFQSNKGWEAMREIKKQRSSLIEVLQVLAVPVGVFPKREGKKKKSVSPNH